MDPQPYVTAAEAIISGHLKVFALDYEFGSAPQWNRDPKSGRVAPLVFGKTLNYRNESLVGDIKYLWEPNRHLHLVTLGQAWSLTHENRYLLAIARHLQSWIVQCPYPKGPNWTSSLELAIRLINWSLVWQLIGGLQSPLFSLDETNLRERWLQTIYRHLHFVAGYRSLYSSANNHLIGELSGLLVGVATWPYWGECKGWATTALVDLQREALRQNAPDGVNREQAISYQQFVLDFLLIAALAGRANAMKFSTHYWQRMELMIEFIGSLMDMSGNVPMIGDADDGYAVRLSGDAAFCPYSSLLATGAIIFKRADFKAKTRTLDDKTRWLLGSSAAKAFDELSADARCEPRRRAYPDGGYYILGCDFETPAEVRIVMDVGPLGYGRIAAHGHADALAFTLSIGGREFLIDPGTYAYHTQKKWRDYFRGTAAHNTVVVDNVDQSVAGGNFMWLKRADARCEYWSCDADSDLLIGSHNGYLRLADPVLHRRRLLFKRSSRRLTVTDTLNCKAQHRVTSHWHLAENCRVQIQGNTLMVQSGGRNMTITLREPDGKFEMRRAQDNPPMGWVSRQFDVKVPATTVGATFDIDGTKSIVTEFICD